MTNSKTSAGPFPCKHSIASITSTELPTADPNGWFISVTKDVVFIPIALLVAVKAAARHSASAFVFWKEPQPNLTSNTRQLKPSKASEE